MMIIVLCLPGLCVLLPEDGIQSVEAFLCDDYLSCCLPGLCVLQPEDGIQSVEAFLFVLDEINRNVSLLPGITLGGLVLDSCNSPVIALQAALKFVKGQQHFVIFCNYFFAILM